MRLSVCIPVHKAEPYIEKCARSLFEQTLEDVEFIFVDDRGGDRSLEVLLEVLKEYPGRRLQVKILHHDKCCGAQAARMTAFRQSSGEYVTFCDADDWVDVDLYRRMVLCMEETDADMVTCPVVRNESDTPACGLSTHFDGSGESFLLGVYDIASFNSMVNKTFRRKAILRANVEQHESVALGEDLCFVAQVAVHCIRVASVDDAHYHYRVRADSASRRFDMARALRDLTSVYSVLRRKLPTRLGVRIRKRLFAEVVFKGMKFGMLSLEQIRWWRAEGRALRTVPMPPDLNMKQRVMLWLSLRCYPLAKLMFAHLSDGRQVEF